MAKITDKLAALPPDSDFFSLEFFPPKTAMGFSNLRDRLDRMSRALHPLFINVTWGAGGSTAEKSLELAEICQRELGMTTCLHLTCTNMKRKTIDQALDDAKALGIRNILALRGDPPQPVEYRDAAANSEPVTDDDDDPEEFVWAVDLVRYIRKRYGDYFCIGVAAYPEGHPDESYSRQQSLEYDLPFLLDKVQAGADFILTQLFFDISVYEEFEGCLRNHPSGAFNDIPIIPGLMPIQSYQMIMRTTKLSHATIPAPLMKRLDAVRGDDGKVKMVGVDVLSELIQQIRTVKCRRPGPRGFHLYTLNLEKAVSLILERTNLIPASPPDEDDDAEGDVAVVDDPLSTLHVTSHIDNDTSTASRQPLLTAASRRQSSVASDPHNHVIIAGRSPSHPEYEATPLDASRPAQPVNTRANTLAISEGEGALGREATWDDYPNGRWGDARSPAYGQIDGYGVSLHASLPQARRLWGTPSTRDDISALFLAYLDGRLDAIPWSEEGFKAETATIAHHLVALNARGWWTLASQPAVNAAASTEPAFGWGPARGFVFQKAFVELFLTAADWAELYETKLSRPGVRDVVCFYATNAKGDFMSRSSSRESTGHSRGTSRGSSGSSTPRRSWGPSTPAAASTTAPHLTTMKPITTSPIASRPRKSSTSTNAVTWGVFPGKEIITPTIIEEVSFRAWSDEAFGIWAEWARIYAKGSPSERLLHEVHDDVWLVNIVHHEYMRGEALWDLLLE